MNTQIETSPLVGMCVTFALMALSLLPMLLLVNTTPDRIPADVTAEEQDRTTSKIVDIKTEEKL
jgi:hypothetical protein